MASSERWLGGERIVRVRGRWRVSYIRALFVQGVAVDRGGDLYIADTANNRIRKVSGGVITTIAGNGTPGYSGDGGPAIEAQLFGPRGIAIDSAGSFYVADSASNAIRKITDG